MKLNHPYVFVFSILLMISLATPGQGRGWWRQSSFKAILASQTTNQTAPATSILSESVPLPKLSVTDAQTVEGDAGTSYLRFVVSLDSLANGYVDVAFKTADATATLADHDYIAASGVVTIAPGFNSGEVLVGIVGDTKIESDETLILTLSDVSANAVLERAVAIGTIYSEDVGSQDVGALVPLPRGVISHGAKGRPIDRKILENTNVSGFLVLQGWNDIEPVEGMFNWEHIDSEVARAKAAGKVIKLTIHAGGDSAPAWIFENYPQVKRIIWYDKVTGEPLWIPAFWDPDYVLVKSRFIEAVGQRYRDTETVFATSVSMADPNTNDWAFVIKDEAQKQSYLDAGFSETAFIDAYLQLIDAAMVASPNQYVVTAVGPIPRALVKDKFAAVHQVLDQAFALYGDRLIIAKGALHAAIPEPVESDGTAWETMKIYSPNTAGQFVWSVTRDPNYKMNGKVPYGKSEIQAVFRQAAEMGQKYGMRWIEPWRIDLLNPDLQEEIAYAASLLSQD